MSKENIINILKKIGFVAFGISYVALIVLCAYFYVDNNNDFNNRAFLYEPKDGFPILLDERDNSVVPILVQHDSLNYGVSHVIKRLVSKSDKVVDIDNSFGYYSLLMGGLVGSEGKVYSFVARDDVYKLAKYTLAMNNMRHIMLFNSLLYSNHNELWMNSDNNNWNNYAVSKHGKRDDDDVLKVSTQLDEALSFDDNIELMHINAGGIAVEILKGAQRLIERSPKVKYLIKWDAKSISNYSEITPILKDLDSLGFEFYLIDSSGSFVLVTADKLLKLDNQYVLITKEAL